MLSRYFDLWTASSIVPVANSQGQYTIQYTPTDNGIFLLRVSLLLPEQAHDNYGLSEVIETMKTVKSELYQSPYVVTVSDGSVSSLTSHAYGVGLSHTTAGVDAYFTVQARDQAGNNRTSGGDALTVNVIHEASLVQLSTSESISIQYLINGK